MTLKCITAGIIDLFTDTNSYTRKKNPGFFWVIWLGYFTFTGMHSRHVRQANSSTNMKMNDVSSYRQHKRYVSLYNVDLVSLFKNETKEHSIPPPPQEYTFHTVNIALLPRTMHVSVLFLNFLFFLKSKTRSWSIYET